MADILHTVQMNASPADVFAALTERAGASAGWARASSTAPRLHSLSDFRFGDGKVVVRMRIAALEKGAKLAWQCVAGPPDWVGTFVTFDLAREGDDTVVRFAHRGWKEATDLMGRCSATWAHFLFGLKSMLETKEPDDLYV